MIFVNILIGGLLTIQSDFVILLGLYFSASALAFSASASTLALS
ncbi:hypothetical protein [Clostridium botulinum]|nr:hypothetical protein [Clostridium botulinum]